MIEFNYKIEIQKRLRNLNRKEKSFYLNKMWMTVLGQTAKQPRPTKLRPLIKE